ncbi:hypothetical protein [Crenobacter intestini]|uniref:Outer envelope protein n=1 Tax=Crenobacter intestini TaxID=2563443 RepID=A0A4T0V6V1_9NEIS|nr:hypothetical protein [Crenobacter intestini]TIC87127.1 hypothetical protein E5K04_01535 [Crenobacter intestini]
MDGIKKIACAGMLCSIAFPALAADWSDTFIGYRWSNQYTEPAIDAEISKNIVSLTHASGYRYGSNFFNVDVLMSDSKDPAAGAGSGGAQELYAVYRTQLSFNKIYGSDWKLGPIKDLALTAGFNAGSKNTQFAPRPRVLVIGPTIKFDVPGFLDVSLLYRDETNHNGIPSAKERNVHFDSTWNLNVSWGIPFHIGAASMLFKGFADYIGEKGRDGFGQSTKPETLVRTALLLDVGQLVAGHKNTVFMGPGYEYWHNKFGNPPGKGTKTSAPSINAEWHF